MDLRDEGKSLMHFKELRADLQLRGVVEAGFSDTDLETVIRLLDGPGVVKKLDFGEWILLKPEWINAYAQAVIRTLRADDLELGSLPVRAILDGQLIFQTTDDEGNVRQEERLEEAEEKIVLQAMEESLVNRALCLRHENRLVFPRHCGRERPARPLRHPTSVLVSYEATGFLDDVYATLIVRLAYCEAFQLKDLWRDAADFTTLDGQAMAGVKLIRENDATGTIELFFDTRIGTNEQVTFAQIIDPHLKQKAEAVQRLRHYACPDCGTPSGNPEVALEMLRDVGKECTIPCIRCRAEIPRWDGIEELFASEEIRERVAALEEAGKLEFDTRRKGQLLVHEVAARFTHANQKPTETPGHHDEGIDMNVEWTDDDGKGTGRFIFLQLKAGNSYLRTRKKDGAEMFDLKKKWVDYWLKQPGPVFLVIGTFPEEDEFRRGDVRDERRFEAVRWMEVKERLLQLTDGGKKTVKTLKFEGEELNMASIFARRKVEMAE